MRLFGRRGDEVPDVDDEDTRDEDGGTIEPSVGETVEPLAYGSGKLIEYSWNPANVLVVLAGATLAAIGIAAIAETEVNSTWYEPIESVLDINHTPLLAAIEIGVGAVMVVLGLAGASRLAAFWCLAAAVGAAVGAIDPDLYGRTLAMERWWAITLAAAGGTLAVLAMLPPTRVVTRREPAIVRREVGRAKPA